MPAHISAPQSQHLTALTTQFGDAPLGRLGGRGAVVEAPHEARSGLVRFASQVKSLAGRAVLALAPANTRANVEVRAAARTFSAHLGDALGALTARGRGLQNAEGAAAALSALVQDAQGLARHGVAFEQALAARLDMHLGRLDREQLAALVKGSHSEAAKSMLSSHQDQVEVALALSMIANRATARLTQEVERGFTEHLQAGLANSLDLVNAGNQKRFVNQFPSLVGKVVSGLSLLTETGALRLSTDAYTAAKGYVKEAMARLPAADLTRLLSRVTTEELKEFLAAASPHGLNLDAIDAALHAEVAERTERLTGTLDRALHALGEVLDGTIPMSDLEGGHPAVGMILESGRTAAELGKHVTAHGLPAEVKSPEALALVRAQIEALFSRSSEFLLEVSAQELAAMDKALGQLALDGPKDLVMQAMQTRREEANTAFLPAVHAFAAAVQSGGHREVLDSAAYVHRELQTLSMAYQALGSKLVDVREQKEFLQARFAEAVGNLPPPAREAIAAFFAQPDVQNLAIACTDLAGIPELSERDVNLATRLSNMSDVLKMIAQAAGSPVPERAPEAVVSPGSDLSRQASAAVFGHFGIVVGSGGQSPVSQQHQQAFTDHYLAHIPATPSTTDPRFNSWFDKDIGRANYVLGGTPMSKESPSATKEALLAFSGSPEMAMAVSRVANQMLVRGVDDALLRANPGAIRLPDGRSIRPVGGDAAQFSMGFEIGRNDAGEITVTGYSHYTGINRVKDQDGNDVDVAPGAEIHYSVEITLAADGTPRVSRPPEFQLSSLVPVWDQGSLAV